VASDWGLAAAVDWEVAVQGWVAVADWGSAATVETGWGWEAGSAAWGWAAAAADWGWVVEERALA